LLRSIDTNFSLVWHQNLGRKSSGRKYLNTQKQKTLSAHSEDAFMQAKIGLMAGKAKLIFGHSCIAV